MERLPILITALLITYTLTAQRTTAYQVPFAVDDHTLGSDATLVVEEICAALETADVTHLEIIGHADVRGSHQHNDLLSQRRARSVAELLMAGCAHGRDIRTRWSGKRDPLSNSDDDPAHALDRRVEVVLHHAVDPSASINTWPAALHQHPRVVPLLPALDPAREHHVVQAEAPIRFTAADGVIVSIPAKALCDAQGRTVTGAVDITYRSFRDPYAIVASGIPMHVQDGDEVGHFETAGMFELYASQGGEAVHLKHGERITLELPENGPLDDGFTGWRLDPVTGQWAAGGTMGTATASMAPAQDDSIPRTEATMAYWVHLATLSDMRPPDTTLFAERRASPDYCNMRPCQRWRGDRGLAFRRNRTAGPSTLRVVGYKGIYDQDRIVFQVVASSYNDFPEWRRIPDRAVWEYSGPSSRRMFKRLYGRKHVYQDVELVMAPGHDHGLLRLKQDGEWLELPVSAAWNRTTPTLRKRWDKSMLAYTKALRKREGEHDRAVQREMARYRRLHGGGPEELAWVHAKRLMNATEAAMVLPEWLPYAAERPLPLVPSRWNESNGILAGLTTTFGLEGFGVYNIDLIMKMPDRRDLIVDVMDEHGEPFRWVVGHAVMRRMPAVVTYWGQGKGVADHMLVSPGKIATLLLTNTEGRTYRADTGPLDVKGAQAVTLVALPLGEPSTLEELHADRLP